MVKKKVKLRLSASLWLEMTLYVFYKIGRENDVLKKKYFSCTHATLQVPPVGAEVVLRRNCTVAILLSRTPVSCAM